MPRTSSLLQSALSSILLLGACKATTTLDSQSGGDSAGQARGLPAELQGFKIAAKVMDGDGVAKDLDPDAIQEVVDTDGVLLVHFDNRGLEKELEKDLRDSLQDLENWNLMMREEIAAIQRKDDRTALEKAHGKARGISVRPEYLDAVLVAARDYSIVVKAMRTTRTNAQSQLVIPNWTDGKAPEVADRTLSATIQRLLDELKEKGEEVKKTEGELEQAQGQTDEETQMLFADSPEPAPTNAKEAKLVDIRRGILAFLPDVWLDLSRTGLERGDRLDVMVEFHRPGTPSSPPPGPSGPAGPGDAGGAAALSQTPAAGGSGDGKDELAGLVEYHMLADDLGWETHVRTQLIVYRATGGTSAEREWEANAAGLVEWAYRFRPSDNAFKQFVNAWEPSFGVHVASLDQGEDSVEIGLGVNLSLFNGLISAGWGGNVSESDHYYFLGGDILKLLDAVKDLAK